MSDSFWFNLDSLDKLYLKEHKDAHSISQSREGQSISVTFFLKVFPWITNDSSTVLTKPCWNRMSDCFKTSSPLKSMAKMTLNTIGSMIVYILWCYVEITMKGAEIDCISCASKDAYISFLIAFVFIKIMKILCKLRTNLFRALIVAKV